LTDAEYRELVAVAELILAGGARERFVAAEKAAGA
jgi:hypothetical protein